MDTAGIREAAGMHPIVAARTTAPPVRAPRAASLVGLSPPTAHRRNIEARAAKGGMHLAFITWIAHCSAAATRNGRKRML